uniref:Secreted protein n=1 Tax=Dromaius novaehollandiae TaxID=8790 RepID=A0A8C4JUG5_DRONO
WCFCSFLFLSASSSHLKGRSPVWMALWRTRWEDWRKSFPHTGHWYFRSPVWERRCRARCEEEMKALPQSRQAWGRSPVCVRLWRTKASQHSTAPFIQLLHGWRPGAKKGPSCLMVIAVGGYHDSDADCSFTRAYPLRSDGTDCGRGRSARKYSGGDGTSSA